MLDTEEVSQGSDIYSLMFFFFHTELYTDIGHKGACWSTSFLDCITIIIKRTVYKDMGKYLNFKAKTFGSFFVTKNILYLNKSNLRKIL